MAIISKHDKTDGERSGTTIIAAGTQLVGDLTLNDSLHIDGSMEGDVRSQDEVVIGRNGQFQGNINARQVIISGQFDGSVDCDRLEIVSSGRVSGNITAGELVIEAGGQFSGVSKIKGEETSQLPFQSEQDSSPADEEASNVKSIG